MTPVSMDDKRLSYIPLEKSDTASGICMVYRNYWWSVHPERGLIMFKEHSPQCNPSEGVAHRIQMRLYPWAECRLIPLVILSVYPDDYVL